MQQVCNLSIISAQFWVATPTTRHAKNSLQRTMRPPQSTSRSQTDASERIGSNPSTSISRLALSTSVFPVLPRPFECPPTSTRFDDYLPCLLSFLGSPLFSPKR